MNIRAQLDAITRMNIRAQLDAITRSATVLRYHTENTVMKQSVGEHTYGVLWLLRMLTNGACSANLLMAALEHDTPEYLTGDIPSPVKRSLDLSSIAKMEADVMTQLHFPNFLALTPDEYKLLKMADILEGLLWCSNELLRGNQHIKKPLNNYMSYAREMWCKHDVARTIITTIEENIYEHFPSYKFR